MKWLTISIFGLRPVACVAWGGFMALLIAGVESEPWRFSIYFTALALHIFLDFLRYVAERGTPTEGGGA